MKELTINQLSQSFYRLEKTLGKLYKTFLYENLIPDNRISNHTFQCLRTGKGTGNKLRNLNLSIGI
jgi:hypothetical protein